MKLSERIKDFNDNHYPEDAPIKQWVEEVAQLEAYCDKLAAGLPEGMLPKDVELLREANAQLADENKRLREAVTLLYNYAHPAFETRQKVDALLEGKDECNCEYGSLGTGRMDSNVCPVHDLEAELADWHDRRDETFQEYEDCKAEIERLREAIGRGLHVYKMPERLGTDWAYAHAGILRDGFQTRDDAINDALLEGGE